MEEQELLIMNFKHNNYLAYETCCKLLILITVTKESTVVVRWAHRLEQMIKFYCC